MDLITRKKIQNLAYKKINFEDNYKLTPEIASQDIWSYAPYKSKIGDVGGYLYNVSPSTTYSANTTNVGNSKGGNYADAISNGIGGTANLISQNIQNAKYGETVGSLVNSAGSTTQNYGGIRYNKINDIDENSIMEKVSDETSSNTANSAFSGAATGASVGSAFGPIGTALGTIIGGLGGTIAGAISGESKEDEAFKTVQKAKGRIGISNQNEIAKAQTTKLQQDFYRKYGQLNNQILFGAYDGKEAMVHTGHGKLPGIPNSRVSQNEWIWSKNGDLHYVADGPNDTALANLKDSDTVFSANKKIRNPETGNVIADDVPLYAALNRLPDLEYNQYIAKQLNGMKNKNNNTPHKYSLGKIGSYLDGNLITSLANIWGANKQYNEASQPLRITSVGAENPYELDALNKLSSLKLNYYPIERQNRQIEGRTRSTIANSGGLSAGQKALLYRQLSLDTQRNNMLALMDINKQNNAYTSQAEQAKLTTGQHSAQLKQQANMFNEEMLAKAHNAAIQGRQMSLFNAMNALSNYYANAFKKKQFDRTMNLYQQDLDDRKAERLQNLRNMGNNKQQKWVGLFPGYSTHSFFS